MLLELLHVHTALSALTASAAGPVSANDKAPSASTSRAAVPLGLRALPCEENNSCRSSAQKGKCDDTRCKVAGEHKRKRDVVTTRHDKETSNKTASKHCAQRSDAAQSGMQGGDAAHKCLHVREQEWVCRQLSPPRVLDALCTPSPCRRCLLAA